MTLSTNFKVTWKAPSNIALIKYWGKKGNQLPANPSLSLTLKNCHTSTNVEFSNNLSLEVLYDGQPKVEFRPKIEKFIKNISNEMPFLNEIGLRIDSVNSFPHSTGIASSASFFASMALCLVSFEKEVLDKKLDDQQFFQRASLIARLGSGSASRSVFPEASLWGEFDFPGSSDLFAVPVVLPEVFKSFHDSVVIVSSEKKEVSSTLGHAMMNDHPFSEVRYLRAKNNLKDITQAISSEDLMRFCEIVELEALELHALMMNSPKSFILMRPKTLDIIQKIRSFRNEKGIPVCFTLDAGPNVHVLYPHSEASAVQKFLADELNDSDINIIHDLVGKGPSREQ